MKIDSKYQIHELPLNLEVIKALDFKDEPILLLEEDAIGNKFLSYLLDQDEEIEQRVYIQISKERLSSVYEKEISVFEAFSNPENQINYIIEFALNEGEMLASYLIPYTAFSLINPIPKDYFFEIPYIPQIAKINEQEILNYSRKKHKLILDFYLQSENLLNNIKPYAFYKVFIPTIEIIKSMLGFDNRNSDRILAFSNLRQGSLGVTIEVNYSNDLFLEKETIALDNLINLLNAQSKEDFEKVVSNSENEKYFKDYATIIKTIIDNNANLYTAYADPITERVFTSNLDKERAEIAKKILDETFEAIEDIEIISGTFLEINIDAKEPAFKIYSFEDDFSLKGKFESSIIEKVKSDFINIGKEAYEFTIKTLYYPETTVRSEEIKRYMIDYKRKE